MVQNVTFSDNRDLKQCFSRKNASSTHSENMVSYQKSSPVYNSERARKSDELILKKIELPFTVNEIVNLPLNELYTRSGGNCWMNINSI